MAKCTICKSKKGKRKCKEDDTFICSLCCGQSRNQDKCTGCSFYKDPALNRNYRKVPFYNIYQMSDSIELEDISNVIESTLCNIALENRESFQDKDAIKLIELFFDKYHFKDDELQFVDTVQKNNFYKIIEVCQQDVASTPQEELVKVMAAVYRSIQRRTDGHREYLQFAQQYVGVRVAPGARVITGQ